MTLRAQSPSTIHFESEAVKVILDRNVNGVMGMGAVRPDAQVPGCWHDVYQPVNT